ncbi:MAG: hypothetical protein MJ074_06430 [Oscillospiraceae bacterium]|nr:hypothetical protein [Oscillospiraceae bacterium]
MNELDDIALRVQVAAALAGVRPCIPDVRRRVAECVRAANPYGCNQYGEGWAHPHNGNSTAYRKMSPFSKDAPRRKVLTSERDGSKTEEVTTKRYVGKGDYQGGEPNAHHQRSTGNPKDEKAPGVSSNLKDKERTASEKVRRSLSAKSSEVFDRQLEKAPPEIRKAIQRIADTMNVQKSDRVTSYQSGNNVFILERNNIPPADNPFRQDGETLWHELGHVVDYDTGYDISQKLRASIREDVEKNIAAIKPEVIKRMAQSVREKMEAYGKVDLSSGEASALMNTLVNYRLISGSEHNAWIRSRKIPAIVDIALGNTPSREPHIPVSKIKARMATELNKLGKTLYAVTDAYGGNGVSCMFGHTQSYFRSKGPARGGAIETWANLFAAHAMNDKAAQKTLKKYLPKTHARFIELLKEMTK